MYQAIERTPAWDYREMGGSYYRVALLKRLHPVRTGVVVAARYALAPLVFIFGTGASYLGLVYSWPDFKEATQKLPIINPCAAVAVAAGPLLAVAWLLKCLGDRWERSSITEILAKDIARISRRKPEQVKSEVHKILEEHPIDVSDRIARLAGSGVGLTNLYFIASEVLLLRTPDQTVLDRLRDREGAYPDVAEFHKKRRARGITNLAHLERTLRAFLERSHDAS